MILKYSGFLLNFLYFSPLFLLPITCQQTSKLLGFPTKFTYIIPQTDTTAQGFPPLYFPHPLPPRNQYANPSTFNNLERENFLLQNSNEAIKKDKRRLRLTLYVNKLNKDENGRHGFSGSKSTALQIGPTSGEAGAEETGSAEHKKSFHRLRRKLRPNSSLERSGCHQGYCTNMFSCVFHGQRPLRPYSSEACPNLFDVCCTRWSNSKPTRGRNSQFRHRRQKSLGFDGLISYSSVPQKSLQPSSSEEENRSNLYHSNFVDDDVLDNAVCGTSRSAQRRILGGLDAGYGQFPWTAHIKIRGPDIDKECGGTLISNRWIMTAGHCTQYCVSVPRCAVEVPQHEITYKVILGEYDQLNPEAFPPDVYFAIDVIRHPLYRNIMRVRGSGFVESEPRYDIALLMLDRPVKLAPNVGPICLGATPEYSDPSPGTLGTVIGWGRIGRYESSPHSNVLQAATVPILSDSQCFQETGLLNFDDQLCAGGSHADTSACPGDSGGALQVQDDKGRWTIVGIVSNGPSICGLQPVIFHKVATSLEWAKSVMEKHQIRSLEP